MELSNGTIYNIIRCSIRPFDKQPKPSKLIVCDSIVVFVCSFIPILLYFQFDGKTSEIFHMGEEVVGPTEVFTGEPEF